MMAARFEIMIFKYSGMNPSPSLIYGRVIHRRHSVNLVEYLWTLNIQVDVAWSMLINWAGPYTRQHLQLFATFLFLWNTLRFGSLFYFGLFYCVSCNININVANFATFLQPALCRRMLYRLIVRTLMDKLILGYYYKVTINILVLRMDSLTCYIG